MTVIDVHGHRIGRDQRRAGVVGRDPHVVRFHSGGRGCHEPRARGVKPDLAGEHQPLRLSAGCARRPRSPACSGNVAIKATEVGNTASLRSTISSPRPGGGQCSRGDLNPEAREISPVWGNFHVSRVTAGARRRQAFRAASCFQGRAAGDVRGGPLRAARTKTRRSRSVLSAESGHAKYPPLCVPCETSAIINQDAQIMLIWFDPRECSR